MRTIALWKTCISAIVIVKWKSVKIVSDVSFMFEEKRLNPSKGHIISQK